MVRERGARDEVQRVEPAAAGQAGSWHCSGLPHSALGLGTHRLGRFAGPSGRRFLSAVIGKLAEAAARSDTDLARAMDRLSADDRQVAAGQLAEALSYDGTDPAEQAATAELRQRADQFRQLLINHGHRDRRRPRHPCPAQHR
jgi:hypothetical protein